MFSFTFLKRVQAKNPDIELCLMTDNIISEDCTRQLHCIIVLCPPKDSESCSRVSVNCNIQREYYYYYYYYYFIIKNTWVRGLSAPMHLGLDLTETLYPISNHGSPVTLLQFQIAPKS